MAKTLPILLVTLFLAAASALGEEQVRRVQEELRKRNLYFGEIDGKRSSETLAALQRYQKRKGFPDSGEFDQETLRSLQLTGSAPSNAPWPEVAVLKSDAAREIAESDRKLLEQLEATEPDAASPATESADAEATTTSPSKPEAETPPPKIALAPAPAEALTRRAAEFVREYLAACETNNLASELAFYADRVNYFDHGTVGRDFIQRDVQRYYKR
ncbi:MAG TPA: peptidoglycan-binding protein, partial [Chthoniobacteraceae bacterium]